MHFRESILVTQGKSNLTQAQLLFTCKEDTKMSPFCLLFFGLLLFTAANGIDIQQKEILHRNHRSLSNLNSMWLELSGTDGTSKFLNYGNWCGLGGSGTPVDPLDGCCQSHDLCYSEVEFNVCKDKGRKALYGTNYKYKIENDRATCDKNDDSCARSLCLCDVVLNNCIKYNFHLYKAEYYKPIGVFDAIMQANYLNSLK